MKIILAIASLGLALFPQEEERVPRSKADAKPQEEARAVKPDRAARLRELSARATVAEKDLLFSTIPEERAQVFVSKERSRFRSEVETRGEQAEFLSGDLEEMSREYKALLASGRKAQAEEYLEKNRKEIIKRIREYSALTREVDHGKHQIEQMEVAQKRLAALIEYKRGERRRYERDRDQQGHVDPSGIDPILIPEVIASEEEEALSPEAMKLFDALFGKSDWDLEAFTVEAAQAARWRL